VDATPPGHGAGSCGPALAEVAGGVHIPIADVSPDVLLDVVGRAA
jgi:hypothetical protein